VSTSRSMTVQEAAEETGLTSQQILNRIYRKKLRAHKRGWIWMIHRAGVERLKKKDTK
jgi:excisionase family DNA binding protein